MKALGSLRLPSLAALIVLGACATAPIGPTMPTGPTVPVLPGSGKSLDQFRGDDALCKQYAVAQVNERSPNQSGAGSGVRSAQTSVYDMQQRYDLSYIQCMYANGHRVPVLGHMTVRPAHASDSPPPPTSPGSR